MADTTFVTVPDGAWVEILAAGKTARISNEGGDNILYVEKLSAAAPTVAKGHTLGKGGLVTLTTPALQSIFAYGVRGASFVAVTES